MRPARLARALGAGEYLVALNNFINLTFNVQMGGAPTDIFVLDPVSAHEDDALRCERLDHEHPEAAIDCRTRQRGRYRGLPNPSLARHDGDSGGGEELQWIHSLRRHSCAD